MVWVLLLLIYWRYNVNLFIAASCLVLGIKPIKQKDKQSIF